jgi:threonine aldolase
MQTVIQSIVEKAGITEAQAGIALETTLEALKAKFPPSIAHQLEGMLENKEFDFKPVVHEKLNELKDEAAEKLEDLQKEASVKIEELKESLRKIF